MLCAWEREGEVRVIDSDSWICVFFTDDICYVMRIGKSLTEWRLYGWCVFFFTDDTS